MKPGRGNTRSDNYVYIYLDPRKPGRWEYGNLVFDYQPFYVGRGLDDRMIAHISPFWRKDGSLKSYIINEILSLDVEPVHFKVFENLTYLESTEIEHRIIKHFGRLHLDPNGILSNRSESEVPTFLCSIINQRLSPRKRKSGKSPELLRNRPVYQYDSKSGLFLNKFDSAVDAELKGQGNRQAIWKCCRGITLSSNKFQWFLKDQGPAIVKYDRKARPLKAVQCFNSSMELVACYSSVRDAKKIHGNIKRALKNPNSKSNGFFWRYA